LPSGENSIERTGPKCFGSSLRAEVAKHGATAIQNAKLKYLRRPVDQGGWFCMRCIPDQMILKFTYEFNLGSRAKSVGTCSRGELTLWLGPGSFRGKSAEPKAELTASVSKEAQNKTATVPKPFQAIRLSSPAQIKEVAKSVPRTMHTMQTV